MVSTIVLISLYINPYLPKPVSIFICALIFLSAFLLSLFTISAHSFEPIVSIMSLSISSCISDSILVEEKH